MKAILGLLLIALVLVVGCSPAAIEENQVEQTQYDNEVQANSGEYEIHIEVEEFVPSTATVRVGDTVTWVNRLDDRQTITFENGDADLVVASQGMVSHTFTEVGEYGYFSQYGPGLRGIVIVE